MNNEMTAAEMLSEANRLERNLPRLTPANRERAIARITILRARLFVALAAA